MTKQGTWAQFTYFKNHHYFSNLLHILVALHRTFSNHFKLCFYDQTWPTYEPCGNGFSIFLFRPKKAASPTLLQTAISPRTTWFLQPFLPHLIRLGELRTYIVDGTIYYIVSTTPVEFDPANTQYTGAQWIRPLSSFRLVSYPPESLIYSNFLFSFFAAMIQINQTTPKSLGG